MSFQDSWAGSFLDASYTTDRGGRHAATVKSSTLLSLFPLYLKHPSSIYISPHNHHHKQRWLPIQPPTTHSHTHSHSCLEQINLIFPGGVSPAWVASVRVLALRIATPALQPMPAGGVVPGMREAGVSTVHRTVVSHSPAGLSTRITDRAALFTKAEAMCHLGDLTVHP